MVGIKIESNSNQIICPQAGCGIPLNDLDIGSLRLGQQMLDKYEKISLNQAIAQMEDMGWCPMPGCKSVANIEKAENIGRCQHCEFAFCLDCKERVHPFKRCPINRLDLLEEFKDSLAEINDKNREAEKYLNELFFKYCTKRCPNNKCGIIFQKVESGCT